MSTDLARILFRRIASERNLSIEKNICLIFVRIRKLRLTINQIDEKDTNSTLGAVGSRAVRSLESAFAF